MKRVEFTPPSGVVPEGTKSGEEFDLVCTFRVKPDGDVCLVMMGDTKMPGYAEREKGKPSYKSEHDEMMGAGGGQTQTGYTAQG